ncbi:MAG: hypothetical protein ACRDZ8_13105 [Acidimicrobiales bacterium]
MPAVNPETNQPISDDPAGSDDDLRGGKKIGDPALADASEQGRGHKTAKTENRVTDGGRLPGEKSAPGSVEKP